MRILPMLLAVPALLLLVALVSPRGARAEQPAWSRAEELLKDGKAQEALALIESSSASRSTPDFFYNVGTIHQRLGNPGLAVAHLEKARALAPGDSDIEHNLGLARDSLARLIGESRLDPASTLLDRALEASWLAWLEGLLGLAAAALGLGWLLRPARMPRWSAWTLGAAAGTIALALAARSVAGGRQATVAIENLKIRSGPGEQYVELARAEIGSKLRRTGPRQQGRDGQPWIQVRYAADGIGWIREGSVLTL